MSGSIRANQGPPLGPGGWWAVHRCRVAQGPGSPTSHSPLGPSAGHAVSTALCLPCRPLSWVCAKAAEAELMGVPRCRSPQGTRDLDRQGLGGGGGSDASPHPLQPQLANTRLWACLWQVIEGFRRLFISISDGVGGRTTAPEPLGPRWGHPQPRCHASFVVMVKVVLGEKRGTDGDPPPPQREERVCREALCSQASPDPRRELHTSVPFHICLLEKRGQRLVEKPPSPRALGLAQRTEASGRGQLLQQLLGDGRWKAGASHPARALYPR